LTEAIESKKKNILILLTASYGGGAERLILDQAKYYDKEKFNLHIITFREGNIENDFKVLKEARYLCLQAPKRFSFKTLSRLIKYINENKISLIHVHLMEPEIYTAPLKILRPSLKIIVTKHNTDRFKKKIHISILCKFLSFFADGIICVSKSTKDFSKKYELVNEKKVHVIYNGIDTRKFRRIENRKVINDFRRKFGLTDHDFVIGVVGRLTKQKGHIYLIEAACLLKNKIPNLKIVIVGEGELKETFEQEAKKKDLQNNLIFTGHVDEMDKLYPILDILCMPSLWEGLSIVLLEAMSAESLVIMSNLPNNKEVARENEEASYFEVGDYEELAEKILYYYNNPEAAERVKKNARKKIVDKFDYLENLKAIERLYLQTLRSPSGTT